MIKKCDTWRKRCAKTMFLKKNWYSQKLFYMFLPIVLMVGIIILSINSFAIAIKEFCLTLKKELADIWNILFSEEHYNPLMLWWIGWRYWSQKKAADYLHGLTDEEERGENWPNLTVEEEARKGLSAERFGLATVENPEED